MWEKTIKSQKETAELRKALSDVKNKVTACEKKLQKVYKEKSALNKENLCLEPDLQNIQDQHQSVNITELQDEIELLSTANEIGEIHCVSDYDLEFLFQTKTGSVYSAALRKLYYKLLANGMPLVKLKQILKQYIFVILTIEDA